VCVRRGRDRGARQGCKTDDTAFQFLKANKKRAVHGQATLSFCLLSRALLRMLVEMNGVFEEGCWMLVQLLE
jgi:hypothetical protein